MSDTKKNADQTQGVLEAKAKQLSAVLAKHNPKELRDLAFERMQEATPGTDEFKCYAALYEVMDILK